MDDYQLLQEFVKNRSEQAFAQIMSQYTDMVHSSCLRQLQDPAQAQDAAQAVFLTLSKKGARAKGHIGSSIFFCQILVEHCFQYSNSTSRHFKFLHEMVMKINLPHSSNLVQHPRR